MRPAVIALLFLASCLVAGPPAVGQDKEFEVKREVYGIRYPWEMTEPYGDAMHTRRRTGATIPKTNAFPYFVRSDLTIYGDRDEFAGPIVESMPISPPWLAWGDKLNAALQANLDAGSGFTRQAGPGPRFVVIEFTVTPDHHIRDLRLRRSTLNLDFNAAAMQVVRSFDGNIELLRFPDSRTEPVKKSVVLMLRPRLMTNPD
jgi:hypothetical protein